MKLILLLLLSTSAMGQKPPDLNNGIAGNDMTLYWKPPAYYSESCSGAGLHNYRTMGARSIRVPVSNETLYQDATPDILNPIYLRTLDTAVVKKIIDSGFVCILDGMHPMDGTDRFQKNLSTDTAKQARFRRYWIAVVKYFKKYDPNRLVFELFNEPTGDWWPSCQAKLVADIRAVDTLHWLVVTGPRSDATMDGLTTMFPIPAKRLIYGFHFYQPDLFVMQGRNGYPWPICYPGYPGCTDSIKSALVAIQYYGNSRGIWNAWRIDQRIKIAADFGIRNGVPVWCGEFMCFNGAPRVDRLRWMSDVVAALRRYGIGFNLWDPLGKTVNLINDIELLKAIGIRN